MKTGLNKRPKQLSAFLNKYQAAIMVTVAALLLSLGASAQVDTTKPRQRINAHGYDYKNIAIDSSQRVPRDTFKLRRADSGSIAIVNKILYQWDGLKWIEVANPKEIVFKDSTGIELYFRASGNPFVPDTIVIRATGGGGAGTPSIGIKINGGEVSSKSPVFRSLDEMRAVPAPLLDTGVIYFRNTYGLFVAYKWSDTSTRADDSAATIKPTAAATGRFILYHEHAVPAMAFGIDPTGLTDCSYAMQKAINYTVDQQLNDRAAYLKIPGGNFQVKYLFIHKYNTPGEYYFVTCTIEGAAPVHDVSSGLGKITTFVNTDGNSFTLGVQKGRNVFIRNLAFVGASPTPGDFQDIIEWTNTDWTTSVRDNVYSPHAAIVIDPFHANLNATPSNRYPGMTAYYSNAQGGGSSQVVIEGCAIRHFVTGIMVSPNGTTQNCDNIIFRDGSAYGNKSFWASGQNQSRANAIINLYSLGGTETLVNCSDYGMNQGSAPNLIQSNIAGGHKYIYKLNGGFNGMNITDTYFESLWSLGLSGDLPVTFKGSQVVFSRNDVYDVYYPPVVAEGKTVNFIGGSIEHFDNENCQVMPFNVQQLTFVGTKIRAGIPFNKQYWTGRPTFKDVDFTSGEGSSRLDDASQIPYCEISNTVFAQVLPGMKFQFIDGTAMEAVNDKFEIIFMETATFEIDPVTKFGYFISTQPGRYQLRDGIVQENVNVDYTNDFYNPTHTTLGWVYAISGDTIKVKYLPYGLTDGVARGISVARIPKFLPRMLADVETGSDTLRNVQMWGGILQVGNRLKGTGLPAGTYIKWISGNKIAISIPAVATATNAYFYDAKMVMSAKNSSPEMGSGEPIIYPGDYIDKTFLNTGATSDSIYRWVAITAGNVAASPDPLFRGIKFNISGGGTQSLNDVVSVGNTTVLPISTGNITVQATYDIAAPAFYTNRGNTVGLIASGNDMIFGGGGTAFMRIDYSSVIRAQLPFDVYDVNGATNQYITMRQNNSTELFGVKPYTNNGNGNSLFNVSTYYDITDLGTYLATFRNQNVLKTFMRPQGQWKYANLNITIDDSTLVHKKWVVDNVSTNDAFTTTPTGVTNVSGTPTAYAGYYVKNGNFVTYYFSISITTSGAGNTEVRVSLPVAADFAAATDVHGNMSTGQSLSTRILADPTNDAALIQFNAPSGSTFVFSGSFGYQIILP
jgi:hypothetical protein